MASTEEEAVEAREMPESREEETEDTAPLDRMLAALSSTPGTGIRTTVWRLKNMKNVSRLVSVVPVLPPVIIWPTPPGKGEATCPMRSYWSCPR
jgi:hypothetical protein